MSIFSNHTLFIIIITVVVSLLAWQSPQLMQRLIFYPPAVQRGQVDRFVTHGFIHADGMHLFLICLLCIRLDKRYRVFSCPNSAV